MLKPIILLADSCDPNQTFPPCLYKGIDLGHLSLNDIPLLLSNIIQVLLALGGALAVIFIIYAGVQLAVSTGDPGKTKKAREGIIAAVVGLILSASAYLLVAFFASRF
jgi:hypothetical protein